LAALQSLPEQAFDQLWCIGDLVDYGARPHEIVRWIKRNHPLVEALRLASPSERHAVTAGLETLVQLISQAPSPKDA